jgi:eukaryotic-like serine/threonine-protein kinase
MSANRLFVGGLAPDFDIACTQVEGSDRVRASLADYRGWWLVLVFYPRDFSLVCPTELTGLGSKIGEFRERGCEVLGISCDSLASHERWVATPRSQGGLAGLPFPLASDEVGMVSRAYGVYLEHQHVALRGLFIIDPNGVLQYQVVHNLSVGRRADEVLRVLAALQTGGLCAENWSLASNPIDPTRELGPGSMISHYRIEERIGSGTFATVFRALDTTLRRSVALKVLKAGGAMTARAMLAEARSAAALSHPNVCTIFGVDDTEGVPIIAMEYLRGQALNAMIKEGPLPAPRASDIGRQIALGMASAHAQGIVHGDLKPDNVIVTHEGVAKILDFGLARRDRRMVNPQETLVLGVADSAEGLTGTPSYMAPEQAGGEPTTPASDVFTFGSILFEMLTGRKAFPGDNLLQVLNAIRAVDGEHFASLVPEPYAPLLRTTFARDPGKRIGMMEIAEWMPSDFS